MDIRWDKPYNNQGLFSDNFLDSPDHFPSLRGDELEAARALQERLAELYAKAEPVVRDAKEAVCEDDLIKPALHDLLGFALDPKPPLPTVETTIVPDFALFADDNARGEAVPHRGEDEFYSGVVGLAEAKPWKQNLNVSHAGRHPGAQIRGYLQDSGVTWGVLTNGHVWRLYHREASRGGFRYYEVDLPELLGADVQDFRYFFRFFARDAWVPDDDGRCRLDGYLQGSRDYWLGLTDRLKDRVYDALTALMTGMVHSSADLGEEDLPQVHEACLVLLYRMLFALYSEARSLLPIENSKYRQNYSIQRRRDEIAAKLDAGDEFLSGSASLWNWLGQLCAKIDVGDEETGVPRYDGGLFRPGEWPLLDDPAVTVPDRYLAAALDSLGRDTDPDTGRPVNLDYTELTVRELGSIYEGLLELRPRYAAEVMIEVPGERAHEIIPLAEADEKQRAAETDRWQPGDVYLVTDRGERKATGSYYTPDYIVSYIVTNTLDPLLKGCAAQVEQAAPDIEAQIMEREKLIAEREEGHPENQKTLAAIEKLKLDLLEPYFKLMVLDPAMGSGHFLVAASEEIAQSILTDPGHHTPAGIEDEDDENLFFKRRVVERCLYGVDLNPLAVELAKLSLWLHTVERGKPLSFLRHHLRHGNSLIGARLAEMQSLPDPKKKSAAAPAQLNLFTQTFAREAENLLRAFNLIELMPTDTGEQEGQKEGAWSDIEARRQRFREVADLWLSVYFGAEVDDADYALAVDALGSEEQFAAVREGASLQAAAALVTQHTFFHWELEFPDAFFTEQGMKPEDERGFDAVVGNPPYGATFTDETKDYLRSNSAVFEGQPDSYEFFLELAIRFAEKGGRIGCIVPNTFLTALRSTRLRSLILHETAVQTVVDLPQGVWRECAVDCVVPILHRDETAALANEAVALLYSGRAPVTAINAETANLAYSIRQDEWREDDRSLMQVRTDGACLAVSARARTAPDVFPRLGELVRIRQGIIPYKTRAEGQADLHTSRTPDARSGNWQPLLASGEELDRYSINWQVLFLNYGDWLWCARQPEFFETPKLVSMRIMNQSISRRLVASFDDDELYAKDTFNVIFGAAAPLELKFILSLFNSRLLNHWYKARYPYVTLNPSNLRDIPTRRPDFDHRMEEGEKGRLLEQCREAVKGGDYEMPYLLARTALAAHAAAYGPAGKPELQDDEYWQAEIAWVNGDGEQPADLKIGPPNGMGHTTTEDLREDLVHDLLAELAQRMMDLNRDKHEEMDGFLRWLERTLGCAIEDLAGRTIIQAYDDREKIADFDALCKRLSATANRKKMTADPRARSVQESIGGEYTASLTKLDALNASLTATDALIDRIVYALYGLGPDEIAIIEESLS